MTDKTGHPLDTSSPTLLLVSLAGVLAAVAGIIVLGQTSGTGALLAAIVVLLAGTSIVTMTIGRQLDDADGGQPGEEARVTPAPASARDVRVRAAAARSRASRRPR